MLSRDEAFKLFRCLSGPWDSKRQWDFKEEGEGCVVEYQEGFPGKVAANLTDALTSG